MDYEQIESAIQMSGFATKREDAFGGMIDLTGTIGRLVCGRRDNTTGHFLARLWVQCNSGGDWFLGLFSGPIYKVSKSDELPALLQGVLRHELIENRAISESAKSRYGLDEII